MSIACSMLSAFLQDDIGKLLKHIVELVKSDISAACSIALVSAKVWAIYQILGETGGMLCGEKDFVGLRILMKYVLRFALTFSGIFVLFVLICPQVILSAYNVSETLFVDRATALRLFSVSLLGLTITFPVMYYYSMIQREPPRIFYLGRKEFWSLFLLKPMSITRQKFLPSQ